MEDDLHMDLDVPAIVQALRKQDTDLVGRIQIRQALFSRRVESFIDEKTEYFQDVTDALANVEIRGDSVKAYVEEFLRDMTQRKKFERRLQKIIQLLEKKKTTKKAPSAIKKTGPYTLYEIKLNHAKVQFKLESLQTLVRNAVIEIAAKFNAAGRPRKSKRNQAAARPISTLSARLDKILKELQETLSLALTVMTLVEGKQRELADLAAEVKSVDQKDFNLIAINHVHVHDMLDELQRTVYDKTVSHLTLAQVAKLSLGRPVKKPNEVVPIRSRADLNKSAMNIQMRLDKITSFCNENLDNQRNDVKTMLWNHGIEEVELYLNEDLFRDMQDILEEGAGPSRAAKPGPSQADDPKAGPSQADDPEAAPSQTDETEAGQSQADDTEAGQSQADDPEAKQSQADETEESQSQADKTEAGPSHASDSPQVPISVGSVLD